MNLQTSENRKGTPMPFIIRLFLWVTTASIAGLTFWLVILPKRSDAVYATVFIAALILVMVGFEIECYQKSRRPDE